jgi:Ca2+-transporting ATPase
MVLKLSRYAHLYGLDQPEDLIKLFELERVGELREVLQQLLKGVTRTDVSKEASDMVLADDNFATIVEAVKEGRRIFDNIMKFIRFQLSTNIGAILTITVASLLGFRLPLTPIQILWVNLMMDGPPAQSLGLEPASSDVVKSPPRKEELLTLRRILIITITGTLMCLGTLFLFYTELMVGDYEKALTVAFTTFVMFQVFNAFNCRSEDKPLYKIGFLSNRYLVYSVLAMVLLQLTIVYVPLLQNVFEVVPLSLVDWIKIVFVSSLLFVVFEIVKIFIDEKKG